MAQEIQPIIFSRFYQGYSPMASLNNLTSFGNTGHASVMTNVDVLNADYITQGPGLATLTDATSAVDELITFIMDKAVSTNVSYAIGATKLFKLSATAVVSGTTITSCADGESLVDMGGNVYGFYNTASAGDILKMPLSTGTIDPDWGSTTPTGYAALEKALHPSATKEDLILFGNGRYAGVYTGDSDTLAPTKLDFGTGNEVADTIFHANYWWIAVNSGVSGTNRNLGSIYLYDGAATTALLADETSVGVQRIGFLYPLNGIVYVAYQDLSSSGGYKIGYIVGRQLKPLGYFSGSLPNFAQKTLYKNTILFVSSGLIYSVGSIIEELPIQISQYMDGGYSTVGAMACPFGEILVSSSQSTSYKIAKASGYDATSNWKSIIVPMVSGRNLGYLDEIVVVSNVLEAGATCALTLEYNQAVSTSETKTITTTGKTRHTFPLGIPNVQDFRVCLDWTSGTPVTCPIREIQVLYHWSES